MINVEPQDHTLREFLGSAGIWERLRGLGPIPVPDSYPSEYLDSVLNMYFGDRIMFNKLYEAGIDFAVQHIHMVCSEKWTRLMELTKLDFSLGGDEATIKTVKEKVAEDNTADANNINQISAFNSDDLIADGGNTSLNNDHKNKDSNRTERIEKLRLEAAFNNLTLADRLSILKHVNSDIANCLTLTTY